jgi:twitching motility protein PilT
MLYDIMSDNHRKLFEETNDIDFSIEMGGTARFRVNVYRQYRGISGVFRKIPAEILSVQELGLPHIIGEIARREKGLVLVTGPTGSGKSTTLAAMIDLLNREREGHILTTEDPIEFLHKIKNV